MGQKREKIVEINVVYLDLEEDRSSRPDGVLFKASRKAIAATVADAFRGISGPFHSFFETLARLRRKIVVMTDDDFKAMLQAVEKGGRLRVNEVSSEMIRMPFTSGPDTRDGERVTFKPRR